MRIRVAYGKKGLGVELPDANTTVVEPCFVQGLDDEVAALRKALRHPLGTPPLRELVTPEDRVAHRLQRFDPPHAQQPRAPYPRGGDRACAQGEHPIDKCLGHPSPNQMKV